GLPIIGNVLDLYEKQWITFTEWKKAYGDVVYFNVIGQPAIVLNTPKAAIDLLERRSAIYSDRVRNIVGAEIQSGGLVMIFMNHGAAWRRLRKAAHEGLNGNGTKEHLKSAQHREAIMLALGFLDEPCAWNEHMRRATASVIMSVSYDTPSILSKEDSAVRAIEDIVAHFERAALPGAHLVEFFPWMMHIPRRFAKWRREAERWFARDSAMFEGLYNRLLAVKEKGADRPSISGMLIKNAERYGLSGRESAWLAGTMYVAGVDTTTSTLSWGILAMLVYPHAQRRAQAELDAVVGRSRVPNFADLPHLHYLRALVRELFRWRPVGPMALPHLSTQDDWYDGMYIPKGTICVPNVWAMNHNVDLFGADAEEFNPDRFLDAQGHVKPPVPDTKDDGHFTFGFGRRVCPGKQVANNSVSIMMAVALWASSFERLKDAEGLEIPLSLEGGVTHGVAVGPLPFQCHITTRFPEASVLLEQ
ncbi:cytochrome P450, partial [Artomyces pyxidatus]